MIKLYFCFQPSFSHQNQFVFYTTIMRTTKLLILILAMAAFFACSKTDNSATGDSSALKFEKLIATDTMMKVNALTTISAIASGDGLSYTWTAPYGTFIGSGSSVQWTVCHSDRFSISCEVRDKNNNSQVKSITIRTIE